MDTIDWGSDWEDPDQHLNTLPYQRYRRSYEDIRLLEIEFKAVLVTGFRSFQVTKIVHRFTKPTTNEISDGVVGWNGQYSIQQCKGAFFRELYCHSVRHGITEKFKLKRLWDLLLFEKDDFLNILIRRFHRLNTSWVTTQIPVLTILPSARDDSPQEFGMDEVE